MGEPFDPYAVLGVRKGAPLPEIARARRALAKEFHPDAAGSDGDEAMRRINLAWEMLAGASPEAEVPLPAWTRPPSARNGPPPRTTPAPAGGHAGWWALGVVALILIALFVAAIIGSLDGGSAPNAPWLRHNLGN